MPFFAPKLKRLTGTTYAALDLLFKTPKPSSTSLPLSRYRPAGGVSPQQMTNPTPKTVGEGICRLPTKQISHKARLPYLDTPDTPVGKMPPLTASLRHGGRRAPKTTGGADCHPTIDKTLSFCFKIVRLPHLRTTCCPHPQRIAILRGEGRHPAVCSFPL